jgi:steroid delta-isomerase-like uncharacterized protein
MGNDNASRIRRVVMQGIVGKDAGYIRSALHDDFRFHGFSMGDHDSEGYLAALSGFWGAFPDLVSVIEDVIVQDDRVAIRVTATGTHNGPFAGIAATGKPITFTDFTIYRLENDGRIAEQWTIVDVPAILAQLQPQDSGRVEAEAQP